MTKLINRWFLIKYICTKHVLPFYLHRWGRHAQIIYIDITVATDTNMSISCDLVIIGVLFSLDAAYIHIGLLRFPAGYVYQLLHHSKSLIDMIIVIGLVYCQFCQSPKIRQGLSSEMSLNSLNEQRTIMDSSLNLKSLLLVARLETR